MGKQGSQSFDVVGADGDGVLSINDEEIDVDETASDFRCQNLEVVDETHAAVNMPEAMLPVTKRWPSRIGERAQDESSAGQGLLLTEARLGQFWDAKLTALLHKSDDVLSFVTEYRYLLTESGGDEMAHDMATSLRSELAALQCKRDHLQLEVMEGEMKLKISPPFQVEHSGRKQRMKRTSKYSTAAGVVCPICYAMVILLCQPVTTTGVPVAAATTSLSGCDLATRNETPHSCAICLEILFQLDSAANCHLTIPSDMNFLPLVYLYGNYNNSNSNCVLNDDINYVPFYTNNNNINNTNFSFFPYNNNNFSINTNNNKKTNIKYSIMNGSIYYNFSFLMYENYNIHLSILNYDNNNCNHNNKYSFLACPYNNRKFSYLNYDNNNNHNFFSFFKYYIISNKTISIRNYDYHSNNNYCNASVLTCFTNSNKNEEHFSISHYSNNNNNNYVFIIYKNYKTESSILNCINNYKNFSFLACNTNNKRHSILNYDNNYSFFNYSFPKYEYNNIFSSIPNYNTCKNSNMSSLLTCKNSAINENKSFWTYNIINHTFSIYSSSSYSFINYNFYTNSFSLLTCNNSAFLTYNIIDETLSIYSSNGYSYLNYNFRTKSISLLTCENSDNNENSFFWTCYVILQTVLKICNVRNRTFSIYTSGRYSYFNYNSCTNCFSLLSCMNNAINECKSFLTYNVINSIFSIYTSGRYSYLNCNFRANSFSLLTNNENESFFTYNFINHTVSIYTTSRYNYFNYNFCTKRFSFITSVNGN